MNFENFVYICYLIRAVKITTFGSKMVIFSARNANIYKIWELHRAIFSSFYNNSQVATKLYNVTHFKMLFPAMVMDFVLLV